MFGKLHGLINTQSIELQLASSVAGQGWTHYVHFQKFLSLCCQWFVAKSLKTGLCPFSFFLIIFFLISRTQETLKRSCWVSSISLQIKPVFWTTLFRYPKRLPLPEISIRNKPYHLSQPPSIPLRGVVKPPSQALVSFFFSILLLSVCDKSVSLLSQTAVRL